MTSRGPRGVCLVDGHNVIHKIPSLARLQKTGQDEEARERLAEACLRFALKRRARVILVFDGSRRVHAPAARPSPHLDIVYASGPRKADGWILERAERSKVVVVTDDWGIKNALPSNAETLSVREFWSALESAPDDAPEEKPTPSLEDVEAYFLEAERRRKASSPDPPPKK